MLCKHKIKNVIFHWYSGPLTLIPQIVERGYYFSINEKMTKTDSGKKIIDCIPSDRILTETDAPYNNVCCIKQVLLNIGLSEDKVYENFQRLLTSIR
jgi:TatD DNase family protein